MPQECVLGPGPGPAGVPAGVSPAPVPCQVVFVQWVLEGVLGLFLPLSFFPFFTSPPKYSASLSSRGGCVCQLCCLEELGPFSAPSGCCWVQGEWAGEQGC